MKPGARTLGVAASDGVDRSVLCGALVRADRVVDGLVFGACTVGGTDATDAVGDLFRDLDREDVRHLLIAGVAPAWFNVVDLREVREATGRPVVSVSFEPSPGLESALREHFSGADLDRRLATYRSLPPRRRVEVNGETVFARAVGVGDGEAARIVRAYTPEGGRPEPLRVARMAARAARRWADAGRPGDRRADG
ncbi:endonuclease dU [Halegenticoccus soli]|uniref:endonuclease dU n=1 Tax=Halegenticoccus soli TaxID=1985678 RepID=UPI000C6D2768|nr:DUF99 family protein [Halegenticoccus soli]